MQALHSLRTTKTFQQVQTPILVEVLFWSAGCPGLSIVILKSRI